MTPDGGRSGAAIHRAGSAALSTARRGAAGAACATAAPVKEELACPPFLWEAEAAAGEARQPTTDAMVARKLGRGKRSEWAETVWGT